jgi:hypothetical protein
MVFSSLFSKLMTMIFCGLTSKPVARVFWFEPQNQQLRFGDFGFKITVTVSWFVP